MEERLVWLDAWEWECCGAPFRVGERVDWTRRDVEDTVWLTNLLGAELAESVTDCETHHCELDEGPEPTALVGEIASIRAVFAARAPCPGEDPRCRYVVAGSASFAGREVGDAAEYSAAHALGKNFEGHLVVVET